MSERAIDHIEELVAEIERLREINHELVETHNVYLGHVADIEGALARVRGLAHTLVQQGAMRSYECTIRSGVGREILDAMDETKTSSSA